MAERMRQANARGGRPIRREVKLTEFEDNALYFAASQAGMTPARFLKESALSRQRGISVTERREIVLSLHKIQAAIAAIGNNINQLARHANAEDAITKEISAELTHSLAQVRATMQRTNDAVSRLAVSPEEADST
ncbi:plasmid mobilization protein [Nesterenkonia sandarakina]|uniref:Mobilization protein MobC n=1 Tax=Nesterenkonia sandarakina TaxID=272918 RepID=A0A2T0YAF7_9MICC|nr:plasmid mobilization relaxosome protein MobC [Nesterenkonia sandarakina]PRZ11677.1 mobilization protein MobC [Nesterenkonia sandarakina]